MVEKLILKWGSLKGWDLEKDESIDALEAWANIDGVSMSAACQGRTDAHNEALCKLIDVIDGTIYLSWDERYVDKDEAKEYILNYGKEKD